MKLKAVRNPVGRTRYRERKIKPKVAPAVKRFFEEVRAMGHMYCWTPVTIGEKHYTGSFYRPELVSLDFVFESYCAWPGSVACSRLAFAGHMHRCIKVDRHPPARITMRFKSGLEMKTKTVVMYDMRSFTA